ncbi:hypothetical protein AT2G07637 [Arabidopsis thaliana]|uniref:Uncharacterized protein n=1 Tax=Arabidopsis thaliana TaxID=3702 RepID=A0A1P8B271_ARATH|nr:uncharacterized protein AT2G07637 [Arabidopsis thaliana]ANM63005.1 hypothetical protein AT2G07637 [Arabidopsis thaliana]|eukprot:NP_001325122.1 hypothetical protein AT2G07637 [Arabidopsis thaliana]
MTRSYIIPLLFQEQRHALRSGRLEERVSTWVCGCQLGSESLWSDDVVPDNRERDKGLGILALFCVLMTVNADEDESEDSLGMIRCMT